MWEIKRSQQNRFTEWWYTTDKIFLLLTLLLMFFGLVACAVASPSVAMRLHLPPLFFMQRQLFYLGFAGVLLVMTSFMRPTHLKYVALWSFLILVVFLILVLPFGIETKGARRWIYVFGHSFQPSEFIRPFFVVLTAWILSKATNLCYLLSFVLYASLMILLLLQPDIGMIILITMIWIVQIFLCNIHAIWLAASGSCFMIVGVIAYTGFTHVRTRIHNFLFATQNTDDYQISQSLSALHRGRFFGVGPGQGSVKNYLPDSHSDFIFAVIGEEFGLIISVLIVLLYSILSIRSILRVHSSGDYFRISATAGLAIQLNLQALINIGVTVHLLPTKGITLPLISYGGSSLLASALSMGMLLALTHERYEPRTYF